MDESATAGLSSGELFFRSDPTAAQSFLPHGLIQWLAASAPGKSEPVRLKAQGDLVRSARQRAVACRAARIAELEADRGYGSSLIELNRLAVQGAGQSFAEAQEQATRRLDARLAGVVLRFTSCLHAEQRLAASRRALEEREARKQRRRDAHAQRLSTFALHLEYETQGAVTLKRLPPSHAQYQRCERAATENVKKEFFEDSNSPGGGCRFDGVQVLDVLKIENKALLAQFQAAANAASTAAALAAASNGNSSPTPPKNDSAAPGSPPPAPGASTKATAAAAPAAPAAKVKGLFCRVPRACVERLVVYGLHRDPLPPTLQETFSNSWVQAASASLGQQQQQQYMAQQASAKRGHHQRAGGAGGINGNDSDEEDRDLLGNLHSIGSNSNGGGLAARLVVESSPLVFPRHFSRHSTLEEDRVLLSRHPPAWATNSTAAHTTNSSSEGNNTATLRNKHNNASEAAAALETLAARRNIAHDATQAVDFAAERGEDWRGGAPQESSDGSAQLPGGGVRFLALCRVLVGRVHVSASPTEDQTLPSTEGSTSDHGALDTLYSPFSEEYHLLTPSYVLPEFLIQFRFTEKSNLEATRPGDSSDRSRMNGSGISDGKDMNMASEASKAAPYLELPSFYAHDDDDNGSDQDIQRSKPIDTALPAQIAAAAQAPSPFALPAFEAIAAAPNSLAEPVPKALESTLTDALPSPPPPPPPVAGPPSHGTAYPVSGGEPLASHVPSTVMWLGEELLDAGAAAHQRRLFAHASLSELEAGAGGASASTSKFGSWSRAGGAAELAATEERGRSQGAVKRRAFAAAAERALVLFWKRREKLAADELAALRSPRIGTSLGVSQLLSRGGRGERAASSPRKETPAWRLVEPTREKGRSSKHRSNGGARLDEGSGEAADESSTSFNPTNGGSGDGSGSRQLEPRRCQVKHNQQPLPGAARRRKQEIQKGHASAYPFADSQKRLQRQRRRLRDE